MNKLHRSWAEFFVRLRASLATSGQTRYVSFQQKPAFVQKVMARKKTILDELEFAIFVPSSRWLQRKRETSVRSFFGVGHKKIPRPNIFASKQLLQKN